MIPHPYLIEAPERETEAQRADRLARQQVRYNAWRDEIAPVAVARLLEIERISELPIEEFFRALTIIARNDCVLFSTLQEGEFSTRLPEVKPSA